MDMTSSTIFPHWHHLFRKKSGTDPLHISEALEVTVVTATKASFSVTHWQLQYEGLSMRGTKACGAGCLGSPGFTLHEDVNQSERLGAAG